MVKNIWLPAFLCVTLLIAACSDDLEDETGSGPELVVNGLELLGLADGKVLEYSRIDTSTSWVPSYEITEDTGSQIIRISGAGDDWVIKDDTVPLLNLKLSDPYVLHNGYWRKVGALDAMVYFPVPGVAMDRSAGQDVVWTGYVPPYVGDSEEACLTFYYGYFGFHFTKKYTGTEQVLVPSFAGTAYRYDVELYADEDDISAVASVVEHYAPGIGMVRQEFRAASFVRVLTLRDYE